MRMRSADQIAYTTVGNEEFICEGGQETVPILMPIYIHFILAAKFAFLSNAW